MPAKGSCREGLEVLRPGDDTQKLGGTVSSDAEGASLNGQFWIPCHGRSAEQVEVPEDEPDIQWTAQYTLENATPAISRREEQRVRCDQARGSSFASLGMSQICRRTFLFWTRPQDSLKRMMRARAQHEK